MGPPWGTWGPYLGIPSVEYFPNVFFWASWTPWASPYLQTQWRPPKNLKIFQGAVVCFFTIIFSVHANEDDKGGWCYLSALELEFATRSYKIIMHVLWLIETIET